MPSALKQFGLDDRLDYEPQVRAEGDELHFTVGRIGYHTHARTQNNQWLMYFMPENVLWLHPEAAKARGVADGERVRVTDRLGRSETLPAKVTPRIRKDTVFMVHGYGHWDERLSTARNNGGADCNLASDAHDRSIGTASMGLSLVRVAKV